MHTLIILGAIVACQADSSPSSSIPIPKYQGIEYNKEQKGDGLVDSWKHDARGVHLVVRGDKLPDGSVDETWHEWIDSEGRPYLRVNEKSSPWSRLYLSKDWEGRVFKSAREFGEFRNQIANQDQEVYAGVETNWFQDAGIQSYKKQSGDGPERPTEAEKLPKLPFPVKIEPKIEPKIDGSNMAEIVAMAVVAVAAIVLVAVILTVAVIRSRQPK